MRLHENFKREKFLERGRGKRTTVIVPWKIVLFIYVGCCFESWLGRWRGGNCRRRSRKRNRDKVDKVVYYLVYFCRNGAYESISFLLISFRFDSLFITNNGEICEIFFFTVSYPVFIYSRILRLSKERTLFLLRSFEISPHPLKHPSIPPPCIQIPASAFPHYFFLLLFLSFFFYQNTSFQRLLRNPFIQNAGTAKASDYR